MSDDLKRRCEGLTLADKISLRDWLSEVIMTTGGRKQTALRCAELLDAVAEAMGVSRIPFVSRSQSHVWARTMVAYQMIKEGYTTGEIGLQMHKNHSTVTHMRKKMQDALDVPGIFKDIVSVWNRFQNNIQL